MDEVLNLKKVCDDLNSANGYIPDHITFGEQQDVSWTRHLAIEFVKRAEVIILQRHQNEVLHEARLLAHKDLSMIRKYLKEIEA